MIGTNSSKSRENGASVEVPGRTGSTVAGEAGIVMSLMTPRDNGIVLAVASNVAHANTFALALKIGDAFTKQAR